MAVLFDPGRVIQEAISRDISAHEARTITFMAVQELQRLAARKSTPLTKESALPAVQTHLRREIARLDDDKSSSSESDDDDDDDDDGLGVDDVKSVERDLVVAIIERELESSLPSAKDVPQIDIQETSEDGRKVMRYAFNEPALDKYFDGKDPYNDLTSKMNNVNISDAHPGWDIITKMSSNIELAVELGKQMRPEDILNLYIASKAFRSAIDGYMLSSIKIWIADRCSEAGHIFPFQMYKSQLIPDPSGRTWAEVYKGTMGPHFLTSEDMDKVRTIPGLKYLQLVLKRDRNCREIAAIMARNGHLMPKSMHGTLLRLWLLNDMACTEHRLAMLRNEELWTDQHLYNAQFLFIKLGMHFNDPVYGPCTFDLLQLILGQRGLYPLWQILMRKRFTSINEIVEAKVRYDFQLDSWNLRECLDKGETMHGVPIWQVGKGHCEGWGLENSQQHLMRPDELIPFEAVKRGLELDKHIRFMITWGYFDWKTGENLVPTEEDMYIEDEAIVLAHVDTNHHWKRRHAMKKRWSTLSLEQRRIIREDDEDEELRALAWVDEDDDNQYYEDNGHDPSNEATYSLEEELKRGYIIPSQSPDHESTVPNKDDKDGWVDFVNQTLMGAPLELPEEEVLRMQGTVARFNPDLYLRYLDPQGTDWIDPNHRLDAAFRANTEASGSTGWETGTLANNSGQHDVGEDVEMGGA